MVNLSVLKWVDEFQMDFGIYDLLPYEEKLITSWKLFKKEKFSEMFLFYRRDMSFMTFAKIRGNAEVDKKKNNLLLFSPPSTL